MRTFLLRIATLLVAMSCLAALPAQGAETALGARQDPTLDNQTRLALSRLAIELGTLREQLDAASTANELDEAKRLDAEIDRLQRQFTTLAAGLDPNELAPAQADGFQLQAEIEELIRPLVLAVKNATEGPRTITALNERLDRLVSRRETILKAKNRLEATRDLLPQDSPERREAERELQQVWGPLLDRLGRDMLVVGANLQQRVDQQVPWFEATTQSIESFLKNSGLNVVLCVLVFLLTYLGLRFVGDRLLRNRRGRRFSLRLAEVLLRIFAVVLAVTATMIVPYARNDWLLLAVGIVFLVGIGWVIVKAAPVYFEQIRLILNVGAVREGERIVVDGLPYRVDALRFYSRLSNPLLAGGVLRVPISDLLSERSRPCSDDEPWFPTRQGDVVAMRSDTGDEEYVGEIEVQTPEFVVVVERHDGPRTYTTQAFLEQSPRNLSRGFEIYVTFGIDYRHQQDALTRVPTLLKAAVEEGMKTDPDGDDVRDITVELEEAAASSIEYAVIIEFHGKAAIHYHDIHRRVRMMLLRACNEHDLHIPLPQLQVHGVRPSNDT